MENKRTLVVTGLVILVILAIIVGTIYYLIQFIRGRQTQTAGDIFPRASAGISQNTNYPTFSPNPAATVFPSGTPSPATSVVAPANTKPYSGQGYTAFYPQGWSLLTCNNSKNIELDPKGGLDQAGYVCNYAVKPVTIIVGTNPSCAGNVITLGGKTVVKSAKTDSTGTDYRWCVRGTPSLDITHRVSTQDTRPAFSPIDYSSQVEQMITNLKYATTGS